MGVFFGDDCTLLVKAPTDASFVLAKRRAGSFPLPPFSLVVVP